MENNLIEVKEIKIGNDTKIEDREAEIWKDVKDYKGYYQISSWGRVKSLARYNRYFSGGIEISKFRQGMIMNLSLDKYGYHKLILCKNSVKRMFLVSRLVGIHFLDNSLNLPEINHLYGDKTNNYYKDLEWSSQIDNKHHAIKTGLFNINGDSNPNAKLSSHDIPIIFEMRKNGAKIQDIAKIYKINRHHIGNILKNRSWKCLS